MPDRHEQVMTLRETPLFIDTAHGLIEIRRVKGDRRSLRLIMPTGVRAHVGQSHIQVRSPWLVLDNGAVRAKHRLLEAVERGDGFQLRAAPPLRVGKD